MRTARAVLLMLGAVLVEAAAAGQVAVFMAFRLGAPAGLTFAPVQRRREATWTAIGSLALKTLRAPVPPWALATKG